MFAVEVACLEVSSDDFHEKLPFQVSLLSIPPRPLKAFANSAHADGALSLQVHRRQWAWQSKAVLGDRCSSASSAQMVPAAFVLVLPKHLLSDNL